MADIHNLDRSTFEWARKTWCLASPSMLLSKKADADATAAVAVASSYQETACCAHHCAAYANSQYGTTVGEASLCATKQ